MKPRVFETDALTIVVSADGVSVYAGHHELRAFKTVRLAFDESGTSAAIEFPDFSQKDANLKVEQETRALSGFKWLGVSKS